MVILLPKTRAVHLLALLCTFAIACSGGSNDNPTSVVDTPTSTEQGVQRISGVAPLTVQFDIADAPGIASAEWDFGDGTVSTELAPAHTFNAPGVYEVQLLARSETESAEITYVVEVFENTSVVSEQPTPTPVPAPKPTPTQTPNPFLQGLPSDLIHWWPAEGTAVDVVGDNHGQMSEGAEFTDGVNGLAFSLDGQDDFIALSHHPELSGSFSFSAWVFLEPDTYQNGQTIFASDAVHWEKIQVAEENQLEFVSATSGIHAPAIPSGEWVHLAAVTNGISVDFYTNGVLRQSDSIPPFGEFSAILPQIGRGAPWGVEASPFGGMIDDLMIFDRALSFDEVLSLYERIELPQQALNSNWTPVGDLTGDEGSPAFVTLNDGTVLMFGANSAEVYNSATQQFEWLIRGACDKWMPAVTLLSDQTVLLTGGANVDEAACAEIYDPQLRVFRRISDMKRGRSGHSATLLNDGRVLIAGGKFENHDRQEEFWSSLEIFDPDTESFTEIGNMTRARNDHGAILLPSGKVLIAGGYDADSCTSSPELFDPDNNTSRLLSGSTVSSGCHMRATRLQNGDVLLTGSEARAELYDWSEESFIAVDPMNEARGRHSATLIPDGRVVIVGGFRQGSAPVFDRLDSVEIFDPNSLQFTPVGFTNDPRHNHAATLLPDGIVLVAGGDLTDESLLRSAEIWEPPTGDFEVHEPSGFGIPPSETQINQSASVFQGHSYLFVCCADDMDSARDYAASMGGYLVSIDDLDEHAYLSTALRAIDHQTNVDNVLIGLSDRDVEGEFGWVNLEPLNFTNWGDGEPNDDGIDQRGEDYVMFTNSPGGKWNDVPDFRGMYIIEFDIAPVVLPKPDPITPPDGLIHWWSGDGDATDLVGGDHGTSSGGTSFVSGKLDEAFSFDGTDDRIEVDSSIKWDELGETTISFWMKPDRHGSGDAGGSAMVVTNRICCYEGTWQFEYWTNSALMFVVRGGQSPGTGADVPQVDRWYHVVGTYDGQVQRYYVDGTLRQQGFEPQGLAVTPGKLHFGSDLCFGGACAGAFYKGLLDEIMIFDRALSIGEVRDIFEAGTVGIVKPEKVSELAPDDSPSTTGPSFVNATVDRLPDLANHALEASVGDIDGDGDLDILVTSGSQGGALLSTAQDFVLNINDGAGRFTNEANSRLPSSAFGSRVASGATLFDADGDSDLDIFVTNGHSGGQLTPGHSDFRNRLWINDGTGTFTDQSTTRLPALLRSSFDSSAGDIDGDGDIDLIVGNVGYIGTGEQNTLLINNGNGGFSEAPQSRLPLITDITVKVVFADLDLDDDLDIVVNNTSHSYGTRTLINNGSGVFSDESESRLSATDSTSDLAVADVTGDGAPEIIISSLGLDPRLFVNSGDGVFSEDTARRIPPIFPTSYGVAVADIDGDEDHDLFVTAGGTDNFLLLNDGEGYFTDVTDVAMTESVTSGVTATFGDFDSDGDPDLYIPTMWQRRNVLLDNRSLQLSASSGGSSKATAVVAGTFHSCALLENSAVSCWGVNRDGTLGNRSTSDSTVPVAVHNLESGVKAISANTHTCAVTADGEALCWGENRTGKLGTGRLERSLTPTGVSGFSSEMDLIAPGVNHTCGLTTSGDVYCWGWNSNGQLGDDTTDEHFSPDPVLGIDEAVVNISSGYDTTCAATVSGDVLCWGLNQSGQLGDGTFTSRSLPTRVLGLSQAVSAVAVGSSRACGLLADKTVRCWGAVEAFTTPVDGLENVAAISAGTEHVCALTEAGDVYCWGGNSRGQLGNGTTDETSNPNLVDLDEIAINVSAGNEHSCAVLESGKIVCWGNNGSGQLGNGTTTDSPIPVAVTEPYLPR